MLDKFKEECGVFGVLNHHDAANIVYLGLYALQHRGQESAGIASVSRVRGAYSVALLAPGRIYVARDPHGFRPLVIGRLDDAFVVSSETCAFDLIEAETVREVRAGEVLVLDRSGIRTVEQFPSPRE